MRAPHLFAVAGAPAEFAPLVEAAASERLRVGWLELGVVATLPPPLEAAASAGFAKIVAAGPGRVLAAKRLAGPAVLRDLVREQFLGCAALLVAGSPDRPRLERDGDAFRLIALDGRARAISVAQWLALLRRPRPEL